MEEIENTPNWKIALYLMVTPILLFVILLIILIRKIKAQLSTPINSN